MSDCEGPIRDEYGNTAHSPGDFQFYTGLLAGITLAAHWEVFAVPDHLDAWIENWRFELNEVAGDPGWVILRPGTGMLRLKGNDFVSCNYLVLDTIFNLARNELVEYDL